MKRRSTMRISRQQGMQYPGRQVFCALMNRLWMRPHGWPHAAPAETSRRESEGAGRIVSQLPATVGKLTNAKQGA